jgi:saccharopine dehydrogenase-like NADP-dependent oxidoreductase
MKYVLVGAGSIGRALIADILGAEPDARFVAIDPDHAALAAAARLGGAQQPVETIVAEANDAKALAPLLEGAAVVVNCTYGARCLEILDAAIAARAPYVDVHGTLLMEERFARHDAAHAAGITVLIGLGVSPGLTNMLAASGARRFEGDVDIDCEYITHRPINPTAGLLETALRQFRNGVKAPVWEDGKLHWHPPFSGAIRTRFAGMDEDVEIVYTPHSEPFTVPRFVRNARRVVVRGAYHESVMTLLKSLYAFGLLDPALDVTVDDTRQNFQPLLRAALMGDGSPRPAGMKSSYTARVRVSDGKRQLSTTIYHAPGWDQAPQGRMTALPAAYGARLVANRKFVHHGVCGSELYTDAQAGDCLAHLRERGLIVLQEET